jgi:pyoverdine/dityrosine biosynthesis protein Dit1
MILNYDKYKENPMQNVEIKAKKILATLLHYRRFENNNDKTCAGVLCEKCQAPHLTKTVQALQNHLPILLVLPAFPAKSANRQKTLSDNIDLGEVLALKALNDICNKISTTYQHPVQLLICSDGRVFNDLLGVLDENVNLYSQGIKRIIKNHKLLHLSTFSLDDIYQDKNYSFMRSQLMSQYGEDLHALKSFLKTDTRRLYQFNGIHRFILEDQLAFYPNETKNQIRKRAKTITYEVIRRSNAWSCLIAERFPHALRLSIHPQYCGSDKMGIQFIATKNSWATPWHNVLLKTPTGALLVKKSEAERIGASLQHDHYVLENV